MSYDQRMQRICSSLSTNGFHCILLGRKLPNSRVLPNFNFATKRLFCFFTKGKFFYLEYNLRLFFYLVFTHFHGVCAIDLDTLLPATLVAKLKGKKLGFDAHEYFTEVPEVVYRKCIKSIWQSVAKFAIPKTDFRYTVGPKLAVEFEQLYQVPFQVIRNLPVLQNIEVNTTGEKYLLYQGALNEGRGLEVLLSAAKNLEIKIILAGEGDLSDSLRSYVRQNNLTDKVRFMGFIEPNELKILTAKAFLGYNLLEPRGLSYYYSLANKFFDYTMASVPCLISLFPEYDALHQKYLMAVPCLLQEKDIIKQVHFLLQNPEEYRNLQENCRKAAADLNWQNEEVLLINIYHAAFD